jgi:hypothetical protein
MELANRARLTSTMRLALETTRERRRKRAEAAEARPGWWPVRRRA